MGGFFTETHAKDLSLDEQYEIYKKRGARGLTWISSMGSEYHKEDYWHKLFSDRFAAEESARRLEQSRNLLFNNIGLSLSEVARLMCTGVSLFIADGDSKLLICRGYLVFPKQRLFMEHWWTKASGSGVVFDPLSDLVYSNEQFERFVIDENKPRDLTDVGKFDCNSMSGKCCRDGEPCEWCKARYAIQEKGSYMAYELVVDIHGTMKPRA